MNLNMMNTSGIVENLKDKSGYKKIPDNFFNITKKDGQGEVTYKLKINKEVVEEAIQIHEADLQKLKDLLNDKKLQ